MMLKRTGQATVEYIFILTVALMLGFSITKKFTGFFQKQMGSIAHVLSSHLTVGICKTNCLFSNYENGYTGGQ